MGGGGGVGEEARFVKSQFKVENVQNRCKERQYGT